MAESERERIETAGLVRELSLFDVTMVGVGAMIGAGIFVLTGIAAGTAGPALLLAFSLNGIVTVLTAMAYAELGSAIPEAGGGYLWVKEGLPAWNAFLAGWMSWFAHAVAGSLYALGFGSYFELVLRNFGVSAFGLSGEPFQKLLAVAVALLFVAINFKGVSETGAVGNVVTVGKILILGIFVGSGLLVIWQHPHYLERFTPFAPHGISGVLVAMGLTFIAFEGYEIIVQAGEEVKEPRKNIPKAVFLSLGIVIPIYLLVAFTALGAVTPETDQPTWQWLSQHAELGLAEAARQFMPLGTTLLLLGGLLSTLSALNATTFSSTRVSFAMGRDRNLPEFFSRISRTTRTPYLALFCSGALILFMALAIPIEDVAAAADVMFLLLFLQVNVAVITIRKKYGDKLAYGYLMPFHPHLPILNIGLILFLAAFMFHFSALAWFFVLGWIASGFLIYLVYASRREWEKERTPIVFEEKWALTETEKEYRVMVAIANPRSAEVLMQVGARVAAAMKGELLLLHVSTLPVQTPLSAGRHLLQKARPVLEKAVRWADEFSLPSESLLRLAHRPAQGVIHTVRERDVDLVVMGWRGRSRDRRTRIGRNIDEVFQQAPCTVVVVQQGAPVPARRILVPVAYPRNARLLLSLSRRLLADDPESRIQLLHVVSAADPREKEERRASFREELEQPAFFEQESRVRLGQGSIDFELVESRDVVGVVAERSRHYDLLVVGSSQRSWWRRRILGEVPYRMARRSACPVIMVNPPTSRLKFSIQNFFQFFYELEDRRSRHVT